jgi:ribosomal protein S18 acetylase RimI-like enzyme
MMAQLKSVPACEGDEQMVARVHLRAMQHNELIHAQFPSEKALDFLRQWLEKDTLDHIHSDEKGVLVTWDNESKDMASFVKWIVHRKVSDEQPDDDQQWPSFCRSEYLDSYADLTANIRQEVMGTEPYYHVTFLCTDPNHGGKGAASGLLREVQRLAAANGMAVVLESTMTAVTFYQRLGFDIMRSFDMMLPPRGSNDPTELYEERCMVWRAAAVVKDETSF